MLRSLNNQTNILTSSLFCVALFFFILTFSISLPIYCRQFYYLHIDYLELTEVSGFTKPEIIGAYDSVLDYLTLTNKEFSVGVMKYSPAGKMHFADCKTLFSLNSTILLVSEFCVLLLLIIRKSGKIGPFLIGKRHASFYSALAAVFIPLIIGALASLNFDKAFEVFHKIFFPQKQNWILNPKTDEIINVLPQKFFMNCAILIGVSILVFSGILILYQWFNGKKIAAKG